MSGWSAPTPAQKIFMPPPVPVDSTTGAGLAGRWPKLLGDGLGVGEHRRRADDADLVARQRWAGSENSGHG